MRKLLLCLLALVAMLYSSVSMAQSVNYPDFSSVTDLTLNGAAAQFGSALRVAPALNTQRGSAFTSVPVALGTDASFRTHFSFQMSNPGGAVDLDGLGADGLAFVVHNDLRGAAALGGLGGNIGYLFFGLQITPSLTVEYDSWYNPPYDPDGNHVGIVFDGSYPHEVTTAVTTRLNNGDVFYSWVDYNGVADVLEVRLATTNIRPATPSITYSGVDLATRLAGTTAYVGFTSATGAAFNHHDVLSWQLFPLTIVSVDIKPGSFPNSINLCSNGVVPVAILGTSEFDVTSINTDSLSLADADVKMVGKSNRDLCGYKDVNSDGIDDLVCQFETVGLSLSGGDTSAKVVGELENGNPMEGEDSINLVKDGCL